MAHPENPERTPRYVNQSWSFCEISGVVPGDPAREMIRLYSVCVCVCGGGGGTSTNFVDHP